MISTEERIHEAALRLFSERGFEATGIREIANEAGISIASLYHYMTTKEDLLVNIMEYGLSRLIAAAELVSERTAGPISRLASLIQLHVWVHGVGQKSASVVDTEYRSLTGERLERIREMRDRYEGIWRSTIQEGVSIGCMDVPEPKLASFALLEMCTGVSHWYSANGELSLSYIGESYANYGLDLVRARVDGNTVTVKDLIIPRTADLYREAEMRVNASAPPA